MQTIADHMLIVSGSDTFCTDTFILRHLPIFLRFPRLDRTETLNPKHLLPQLGNERTDFSCQRSIGRCGRSLACKRPIIKVKHYGTRTTLFRAQIRSAKQRKVKGNDARPALRFDQTHGSVDEQATHIMDRVVAFASIADDILYLSRDQHAGQLFCELAERRHVASQKEVVKGVVRKPAIDLRRMGSYIVEKRRCRTHPRAI